ncbi:uncharacterized protein LOC130612505 [Hydractinia symbiolongicarpus]|uniref:uncharacterized protein LOC130612505 n=1 Tax=Hydractinia symbiolongicarpus TaxID=13093 RepID=UPI002550DC1D|nr:uncharacterized protein LOC130612505 [Hydractinia symbiolongicarpus]
MAKAGSSRRISLEDAVNYMLETDDSDIDSCHGGLSSDEEERIDNALLGYYSDWDENDPNADVESNLVGRSSPPPSSPPPPLSTNSTETLNNESQVTALNSAVSLTFCAINNVPDHATVTNEPSTRISRRTRRPRKQVIDLGSTDDDCDNKENICEKHTSTKKGKKKPANKKPANKKPANKEPVAHKNTKRIPRVMMIQILQTFYQILLRHVTQDWQLTSMEEYADPPVYNNFQAPIDKRYNTEHMPVFTEEKRNCKVCYAELKKQVRVYTKCSAPQCDVYLHFTKENNCFQKWHTTFKH